MNREKAGRRLRDLLVKHEMLIPMRGFTREWDGPGASVMDEDVKELYRQIAESVVRVAFFPTLVTASPEANMDPNENVAIGECFDVTRPLGERLREAADIIDGPAWLDQLLHQVAREVEALHPGAEDAGPLPGRRPSDGRTIDELIERSSLGTPAAKAIRGQADPAHVARALARADELAAEERAVDRCRCGHSRSVHKGHICYGASLTRRCTCDRFELKEEA